MTPERWQQVKVALDRAMALSGAARDSCLRQMAQDDRELHDEIVSLLASDAQAGSAFLNTPAPAALGAPAPEGRLSGRRIGPYRLIVEIGRGGMGEVYRAVRADEEYHREVAIKLVRAGREPQFVAARLRTERQILASLEHPNIATLLDGGTTEEGVPYLVMPLIAGEPIDVYCTSQRLDTSARLELFLQVCSAVQYAHQHMVIHRDLKPSNILVAEGGVPRLLDFGIAKVVDPGALQTSADLTINEHRILTPDYASPEQFKGSIVTAASDVYSLGVVLYELLTGRKPFAARGADTSETEQKVLHSEPPRPSAVVLSRPDGAQLERVAALMATEGSPEKLSRRLRGDLDNILLMALRKEPERRYVTVAQFAEDIRRHLQRLPVRARKDTVAYRATRFVRRHAVAVAAGTLVTAALLTGIAATTREARVAEAQRVRAEKRFNDVRALSNALIFDFHDSIRNLSGAAESRRLLVRTALRYLEGLSQEAQDDPALQRELASALLRLGDLQGQALEANESDFAGAQKSYRRSYALLESSLALDPSNEQARRDIVTNAGKLSDLLWYTSDPNGALSFSGQTLAQARILVAAHPDNEKYRTLLAICEGDYAYKLFQIRNDAAGALPYVQRSLAALEAARSPRTGVGSSLRVERTLALTYTRAEDMYETLGQDEQALKMAENARRLLAQMTAAAPDDADLLHLKAFADHFAARALVNLDRLPLATEYEQAALRGFRDLISRDGKVDEYRMDVVQALNGMARIAIKNHDADAALSLLRDTGEDAQELRAEKAGGVEFRLTRAQMQLMLADAYSLRARQSGRTPPQQDHDRQLACTAYASALARYTALSKDRAEAAGAVKDIRDRLQECGAGG